MHRNNKIDKDFDKTSPPANKLSLGLSLIYTKFCRSHNKRKTRMLLRDLSVFPIIFNASSDRQLSGWKMSQKCKTHVSRCSPVLRSNKRADLRARISLAFCDIFVPEKSSVSGPSISNRATFCVFLILGNLNA